MKKKIVSAVMALVLLMGCIGLFAACGKQGTVGEGGTNPRDTDDVYKVAIVQLADNGAFTEMREAFIQRMRELGYDEAKMTFDIKNAQGDQSTLQSICGSLKDYDLIVPIVTPATAAVVNQTPKAPVVFISVTNPVASGVLTTMEAPDKKCNRYFQYCPCGPYFHLGEGTDAERQEHRHSVLLRRAERRTDRNQSERISFRERL